MAIFFRDSLTAFHFGVIVNDDGSVCNVRDAEPFVQDLPCQMSFSSHDNALPSDGARFAQQRSLEIFVKGIGYDFKSGDLVIVYRNGAAVYEGQIGEPRVYGRLLPHIELTMEAYREIGNGKE